MRINSKLPKTFSIYLVDKNGSEGYLRYHSVQNSDGSIRYHYTLEKKHSEASKYINYDNTKKIALKLCDNERFEDVRVIDNTLKKTFYVKKNQKKQ